MAPAASSFSRAFWTLFGLSLFLCGFLSWRQRRITLLILEEARPRASARTSFVRASNL